MTVTALLPAPPGQPAPVTAAPPAGRSRPLTMSERRTVATVAVLSLVLGLIGFANSFRAVASAARASFGPLAFTVPIGVDLGIAVFSALDIVLARLDLRPRWLRLVPWTLTAATVYLNVTGQPDWFARIAHAVFPVLWVITVEIAAHVARVRAGLAAGTAMDRIRPSRWLLAPLPTARLARRMVLWEIRSYPDALRRERDRLLALTELQDAYGRLAWRWKAPRRVRALYRLGELAPATASPGGQGPSCPWPRPAPILPAAPGRPAPGSAPEGAPASGRTRTRARGRGAPHTASTDRTRTRTRTRTGAVTGEAAGVHFAAGLAAGQVPSIRRIRRELHVGQDRAARIHAHLAGLAATPDGQHRPAELSGRTA
jgi:hypothetical protein